MVYSSAFGVSAGDAATLTKQSKELRKIERNNMGQSTYGWHFEEISNLL
jgi:hypothetical protein